MTRPRCIENTPNSTLRATWESLCFCAPENVNFIVRSKLGVKSNDVDEIVDWLQVWGPKNVK